MLKMFKIHRFYSLFESKKNNISKKDESENKKLSKEILKDKGKDKEPLKDKNGQFLLYDINEIKPKIDPEDYDKVPYDFLKKYGKIKKEPKKIKKSELEKHPFFDYITPDILKSMIKKDSSDNNKEEDFDIIENDIVYDIERLPIQIGDYVVCKDFEDLNKNQIEFLNSRPYHKVRSIMSSDKRYYSWGEPYIDIGYNIPFKMRRFHSINRNQNYKYKVLFLQFDLQIDTHGEKDVNNYFRNQTKMSNLFEILFKERLPECLVDFNQYDDVYSIGEHFFINDLKIKDYDFVFFGHISNFTTIVKMIISYLDKYNIPYIKYGTYKDLDNKAYEMNLMQKLGYPYIPSVMTSKITKRVLDNIKEFGFPVIVKDVNLNRGEGVWKVDNLKELIRIFDFNNKLMLIQKFIPNDGDYRVITIKNKVELIIKKERIKGSNEFRANVARGGKAVKGTLPMDIIKMCEEISHYLVCDIVGFDIIKNKDTGEYYVMETNSSPHFSTFSVISGIDIPGIITDYIIKKINY